MPELNKMLDQYPNEALELARLVAIETTEQMLKKLEAQPQKREWITKEEALALMNCSYSTLNNRVNMGFVRKNTYGQHGQKYYNRLDIEAFLSGRPNQHQP